jgi:tripartite-type tricarboxylate transporter receptor subunit TctC
MRLKKIAVLFIIIALASSMSVGCTSSNDSGPQDYSNYPEKDIQGTIMWSAGGVNDTVSRSVGPFAEDELEQTIIFTNRPGAAGGVSTQYVHELPADGYNLLFGSENPQIAKVMGTSTIDYSDFEPITILASGIGVVLVNPNSDYKSLEDLVDDMLSRPGKVKMATTGPGGLPFTLAAMMENVNGIEPQMVVFDGEAEAVTAIMGEHVDYTIATYGSCAEAIRSGKVKGLAVFHDEEIQEFKEGLGDVPLISDVYSDYNKYLPWGPFHGVFVKKGTPQEIIDILTDKFTAAANNEEYINLLINMGNIPAVMQGEEAREFIDNFRSTTSWLMYEVGATEKSPEEFGIERID